jgi:hypothetical protein
MGQYVRTGCSVCPIRMILRVEKGTDSSARHDVRRPWPYGSRLAVLLSRVGQGASSSGPPEERLDGTKWKAKSLIHCSQFIT